MYQNSRRQYTTAAAARSCVWNRETNLSVFAHAQNCRRYTSSIKKWQRVMTKKISCQSIFCWMYLHWWVWERRLFSSLRGHSHKQENLVVSLLSCKIKSLPSGFCVHCYNFNKFFIWRWKVVPQLISIFRIVWQILGAETASFSAKQAIMNRD